MRVKVLFFGQLKDITGRSEEVLEVADGSVLGGIFEHYAARFQQFRDAGRSIVMARNQQFSDASSPVSDGDEIAFLPPVSGGSGPAPGTKYTHEVAEEAGHFFALTRDPVDIDSIKHRLLAGTDGAVVVFEGVVRNNTKGRPTRFLDYEAYEPMAIQIMTQIGREIASKYQVGRLAMVHRLGRMDIGETSVAIVVTAPHRKAGFDAAFEGINQLKKLVPIWKKEYFEDGEVWVEGEWDQSLLQR